MQQSYYDAADYAVEEKNSCSEKQIIEILAIIVQ